MIDKRNESGYFLKDNSFLRDIYQNTLTFFYYIYINLINNKK